MIDAFLITMEEDIDATTPEVMAITIGEQYLAFLEKSVKQSTDWLSRFTCNYLLVMRMYTMFHSVEKVGCSLTMEYITKEFLPVFYCTNKTHSFETNLKIIELYYQ